MFINGKEPLTILGMVVAAVALMFVPKCSAPMVTIIAQNPEAYPKKKQHQYMVVSELFKGLK